MKREIALIFIMVLCATAVLAAQSGEPVLVRVSAFNPATRLYTFTCTPPPGMDPSVTWTVRPDTPQTSINVVTTNKTMIFNLSQNVVYHVGCQVQNATNLSQNIRGDFHIDRRTGPNTDKPDVKTLSTNGRNFVATCTVPTNVTHYNLYWTALGIRGNINYPQFNNLNTINASVNESLLWDLDCGVWDLDHSQWMQWGYPVEFFSSGPAYIPTIDGCTPGDPCPWNSTGANQTNTSTNTSNLPPNAPLWLEPGINNSNVDTYDFHIQVFPMTDAENDAHVASDFEMWDVPANQRVWSSLHNTVIKLHIHNADGTFEGSLNNKDRLLYSHEYMLRARFYEQLPNGTQQVGNWSEWRHFITKQFLNFTTSPYLWTARDGYTVQLVASNISVPVNVEMAPKIYNSSPNASRPLLYITQLYGQIGVVRNDGRYSVYADHLLNYDSFGSLPGAGETGVDGLYVDPAGDLFVSMVYHDNVSNGFLGKVMRFKTNATGDGYINSSIILSGIPVSPSHHVHIITRGPDGKLYLNTGDGDNPEPAGQHNLLNGKVLRFNENGSIPADNPYPGSYVYASGFRNAFGGAWRPGTNEYWVSNNGPDEEDGIYKVFRGSSFGWCCNTSSGTWHTWHQTVAPTQLVFDNGVFPNSTGSFYVATSGSTYSSGPSIDAKRIVQFKFNPDGTKQSVTDLVTYTGTGYGDPIGLAFGDDGLYFTDIYGETGFVGVGTTRGNIYKIIVGNQSANQSGPPNTSFSAGIGPAPWYPQGLTVVWQCVGIGGSGNYRYDFDLGDGDKQFGTSYDNVYHTYGANGTYNVSCAVHDLNTSLIATASTSIVFGTGINQTNTTNTTNTTTCYNSVQNIPANCTGGVIGTDTFDGCRHITCSNGGSNMQVLACDKSGYFEMYKQGQTGTTQFQICLGTTCISDSGFAASPNYPICLGNVTLPPTNGTNGTGVNITLTGCAVNDTLHEGQTNTYSFADGTNTTVGLVLAQNTTAVKFSIDSQLTPFMAPGDAFTSNSSVLLRLGNVQIGARDSTAAICLNRTATATRNVSLQIAPWFPQGRSYVFLCNATGFTPTSYDYYFGDGNKQSGRTASDVYYTYSAVGNYGVLCTARNGTIALNGTLAISVT